MFAGNRAIEVIFELKYICSDLPQGCLMFNAGLLTKKTTSMTTAKHLSSLSSIGYKYWNRFSIYVSNRYYKGNVQ